MCDSHCIQCNKILFIQVSLTSILCDYHPWSILLILFRITSPRPLVKRSTFWFHLVQKWATYLALFDLKKVHLIGIFLPQKVHFYVFIVVQKRSFIWSKRRPLLVPYRPTNGPLIWLFSPTKKVLFFCSIWSKNGQPIWFILIKKVCLTS